MRGIPVAKVEVSRVVYALCSFGGGRMIDHQNEHMRTEGRREDRITIKDSDL